MFSFFYSSLHDHSDAHCFLKVLDGRLKETQFAWPSESDPEKPLEPIATRFQETNEVAYMNGMINCHLCIKQQQADKNVKSHSHIISFVTKKEKLSKLCTVNAQISALLHKGEANNFS